jgi:hypothetical protein
VTWILLEFTPRFRTETYYKIQSIANNLFLYAEGNSLQKAILIFPAKILGLLGQCFFFNKKPETKQKLANRT